MKVIEVTRLIAGNVRPAMADISAMLDELGDGQSIDTINWQDFSYKPEVRFNIAWGPGEIYLKYYVRESNTKAEKDQPNQMVCEDSCVEFFVSPADDGIYYNFEFNPIGTALLGAGHGRADSKRADPVHIEGIRRLATMGEKPFGEIEGDNRWSLTVAIPLDTFFHHHVTSLKGKTFRANFYKCGDKLSNPHFVTWNPVKTGKPDYHRPEFFGTLKFI
jgi:hypothetical protein